MGTAAPGGYLSWLDFPPARPASDPAVADVIGAGFTHREEGRYRVRGAAGFEAGGPADLMGPCSVLAELTGQTLEQGLGRLTDDEVVGVLRAARRLVSWQSAVELAAVTELAARRHREHHDAGPAPAERTSAEVAAALTLTGRSADLLTDFAAGVARLEDVAAALGRGDIDAARAHVFADELAALPWLHASVIATRHLQIAGEVTTARLRSMLRRAVLAADPDAGRRRQRAARQDARVQAWPESSGNAALAGRELPAGQALLADRHVSALAKSLQAAGLAGTLDQVRAEVFLALLSGQTPDSLLPSRQPGQSADAAAAQGGAGSAGWTGDAASAASTASASGASSASGAGSAGGGGAGVSWPAGPLGTLHLTMPLDAWLGQADSPGHIAGHGPADAWTCRDLAATLTSRAGTSYCLTITTPDGHPVGHGCTKTPPPRAGPAPPGPAPPESASSASAPPGSASSGSVPPGSKVPGPAPPGESAPPAAAGPAAAWIAGLQPEWLNAETCDHSRQTAGYQPGQLLGHLIKIRNPTCSAPGCRRPAHRCDLDHVIPYHLGGRTCECNLHPLCRRHHRCKGSPGWQLDMPEPGVLTWRLPHGRTYTTRPEPYPV